MTVSIDAVEEEVSLETTLDTVDRVEAEFELVDAVEAVDDSSSEAMVLELMLLQLKLEVSVVEVIISAAEVLELVKEAVVLLELKPWAAI